MKGILLAGGHGTRLYPCTKSISKQLLPVYDKPMIYYPLSLLMLAGIREVLVISTPIDLPLYRKLFGDGSLLGMCFEYIEQPRPEGLAQAFIIGKEFLAGESVCMVLGDNVLYGHGLMEMMRQGTKINNGALVFAYQVKDPERYGVLEFDQQNQVVSIEEKPKLPKSSYAVPGVYFYGSEVCEEASRLKPSQRGELEITDLNAIFLNRKELKVIKMGRGITWFDTGTHESLHEASGFIQSIQNRQGLIVACLEEIAWRNSWIQESQVDSLLMSMGKSDYASYVRRIFKESFS